MIYKIDITLKNNNEIQEFLKDGYKIIEENKRFYAVNEVLN